MTPPRWLHWPAGSSASWTPSDVSGLLAWYKADSISQSDNTDVTSWTNSEGTSGRDLVNEGTAPKFRTNVQNALPVIRFGGSGNLEVTSTSGFIPNTQSAVTVACVCKVVSTAVHMFVSVAASTNSIFPRCDYIRKIESGSYPWRTLWGGTNSRYADGPNHGSTTGYVIAVTVVDASLVPTHRIDGTSGSLTFGGAYSNYSGNGTASPTAFYVGCTRDSSGRVSRLPNTAEVAEIVYYDSALSAADAEKLEGYLAHKWGLETNLPSTHPYRNSAP